MTTHVALLRAVNVGGRKPVAMAALRAWLEALGFEDARTVLQSGNLVFRGGRKKGESLARFLEAEAVRGLGLRTEFLVRSSEEWAEIVARNPFRGEAARDPGHLLVLFLKDAPTPARVSALRAAIKGREVVQVAGREAYAVYPDGIGRSRLTTAAIERALGTRVTGRNWNTVLRLAALI